MLNAITDITGKVHNIKREITLDSGETAYLCDDDQVYVQNEKLKWVNISNLNTDSSGYGNFLNVQNKIKEAQQRISKVKDDNLDNLED